MIEQVHFPVSRQGIPQPFSAHDGWGAFLGWMDDSADQVGWDKNDPIFPGWALTTHILDPDRFVFRPTHFVQWGGRQHPERFFENPVDPMRGMVEGTRLPSGEAVRGVSGAVTLPDAVILEQMQRRAATLIADAWRGLSRRQRSTLVACYERGLSPGRCPGIRRGARQ